jgi:hypothetical protein
VESDALLTGGYGLLHVALGLVLGPSLPPVPLPLAEGRVRRAVPGRPPADPGDPRPPPREVRGSDEVTDPG